MLSDISVFYFLAITTTPTQTTTTMPSSIPGRKPLNEDFVLEEQVIENIASIPEDTKRKMGYQPDEFIVDCQYEGWQCNEMYVSLGCL